MYGIYSVKLLFESTTSPDLGSEKIFEERIILVRAEKVDDIKDLVYKKFPSDTYLNGDGGMTTNQLVEILDIFELVDNLEESLDFKEVYSRYLLVENDVTTENIIELYSLDK